MREQQRLERHDSSGREPSHPHESNEKLQASRQQRAVRTMRHCSGCKSTRLRKYSLTPQMHASCRSCNKGTRSVQPSLCWQKNPLRFPNRIGVSKIRKQACKTKMMMKKNKGRATAPTVEETHPSAASSSESAFASSPTMEQGNVGTGCGDFPEADVRTD